MRSLIAVLAAFALLAPAASANGRGGGLALPLAQRDALIHGIAGDEDHVFVTEPGVGVSTGGPRIVVLDRDSGREEATLPAPPGGFKLPFTLRAPETGHLVVLDSGGFPPQGPPVVYDYAYSDRRGRFSAALTRTGDFTGLPLGFAEDVEVLPNGEYVVSESVFGGLWLIGRDGRIRPGIVPDDPSVPLKKLGPCEFPDGGTGTVGDLPFQDGSEVFLVGPVRVPRLVGEVFPDPADGGGLQHPGQVGQFRRQAVRPGRGGAPRRGRAACGGHEIPSAVVGAGGCPAACGSKSTPNRAS